MSNQSEFGPPSQKPSAALLTSTALGGDRSLPTIAARINAEHHSCVAAFRATLGHARVAGDLLINAKGQIQHGQWGAWLKANCPDVSDRTARNYMRVARHWNTLPHDVGLREGLALLAEPKTETVADLPRYAWEDQEHFKRYCSLWGDYWSTNVYLMSALGVGVGEIADRTGKTVDQCLRALAPEFPDRWQKPPSKEWFSLYYCLEKPDLFIPYYSQCQKYEAYRLVAENYQRAVIAAEHRQDLETAKLLAIQCKMSQDRANQFISGQSFLKTAALSTDNFVLAVWAMMAEDTLYSVGITERSEVDDGGFLPVFYVLAMMHEIDSLKPTPD